MAVFIGYNTINQFKNVTLTDFELIKRDLLNAFNIRQGEVPGKPGVGTTLWNFIFDNQTPEVTSQIYNEVQRVTATDPRIYISDVQVYAQENGLLIELQVATVASSEPEQLAILFDEQSRRASFV